MNFKNIDEFTQWLRDNNANKYEGETLGEALKDEKTSFAIVCLKCGSTNVLITGELGTNYGEWTGYASGENIIKCKSCGNAISWRA